MNFYIANQTVIFLYACVLGVCLSFVYDVFRLIRITFNSKRFIIIIQDIIFFIIVAVSTFLFLICFTEGMVRFYVLFGEIAGFIVCHLTIGAAVVFILGKIIVFIKKILKKIFVPIYNFTSQKSKKICKQIVNNYSEHKKNRKIRKKHLKNTEQISYNQNIHIKKAGDGEKMSRSAKKRKNNKPKNIIIVLAFMIFLGYAVVSLSFDYTNILNKKSDVSQLQSIKNAEENKGKQYDYLLQDKNFKEYAEGAARDAGYVEPDERVFIDGGK